MTSYNPCLAPSAPPTNFSATVVDTAVCLSWDQPPEGQQNGVIISYLVTCNSTDYTLSHLLKGIADSFCIDIFVGDAVSCQVLASTAVGDGPSATITVQTEGASALYHVLIYPTILNVQVCLGELSSLFH